MPHTKVPKVSFGLPCGDIIVTTKAPVRQLEDHFVGTNDVCRKYSLKDVWEHHRMASHRLKQQPDAQGLNHFVSIFVDTTM